MEMCFASLYVPSRLGISLSSRAPSLAASLGCNSAEEQYLSSTPNSMQRGSFRIVDTRALFCLSRCRGGGEGRRTSLSLCVSKKKAEQAAFAKRKQDEKTSNRKVNEDAIEMQGKVVSRAPGQFRVELKNGAMCICTIGGKLSRNNIYVVEGDSVTVELTPYDLTRGRIIFRSIDKAALETHEQKAEKLKNAAKYAKKHATGTLKGPAPPLA